MSRGIETIETVSPTGSSETTISVSVSGVVRPGALSMPISRTFRRSVVPGPGGRVGSPAAGGRKTRSKVSSVDVPTRLPSPCGVATNAMTRASPSQLRPARLPGVPPVEERLPDRREAPDEDEAVEHEDDPQRPRDDDRGDEAGGRVELEEQPGDAEQDQGGKAEQRGEADLAIGELAQARQDGRQDRAGEPTAIARGSVDLAAGRGEASGVRRGGDGAAGDRIRAGPAGGHERVWSPRGSAGVAAAPSLAGSGRRDARHWKWRRRAVHQPASHRPASGSVTPTSPRVWRVVPV